MKQNEKMSEKMKRAIAYVRVSTEEQGSDDRFGVEVQMEAIKGYCQSHGVELVRTVTEKMSGAKERPLMNELVFGEDVVNPPYDMIIVYKNDRIARDMKLYFYYEYVLNKRGIELVCVQDEFLNGVDSSVATLYKAMMQFVAEQERKNITMRTSSGRLAKAKRGGYAGGAVPYGYRCESHKLVVSDGEAEMVKKMFSVYDDSGSIMEVKRYLDRQGYLARNGKQFSYYTIRDVLQNREFYQGLYRYSGLGWVKGEHQAILKLDSEFHELEEKRNENEVKMEMEGEIYG